MRSAEGSVAGLDMEQVAGEVARRCLPESMVWTLTRLRDIRRELRGRLFPLAMLAPGEGRKPVRLVQVMRVVADLIREPGRVDEVRPEDVAAILTVIAALEGALAARLMSVRSNGGQETPLEEDRLLTAREAAEVLGVSADYLYRHSRKLPFAVRPTPGTLRFSAQGVARFIRQRRGR